MQGGASRTGMAPTPSQAAYSAIRLTWDRRERPRGSRLQFRITKINPVKDGCFRRGLGELQITGSPQNSAESRAFLRRDRYCDVP